jgi:hypothetical protein
MCYVQLVTCDVLRATCQCEVRRATCDVLRATCVVGRRTATATGTFCEVPVLACRRVRGSAQRRLRLEALERLRGAARVVFLRPPADRREAVRLRAALERLAALLREPLEAFRAPFLERDERLALRDVLRRRDAAPPFGAAAVGRLADLRAAPPSRPPDRFCADSAAPMSVPSPSSIASSPVPARPRSGSIGYSPRSSVLLSGAIECTSSEWSPRNIRASLATSLSPSAIRVSALPSGFRSPPSAIVDS